MASLQPERVVAETRNWLQDPFNEQLMFEQPLAVLREFAADRKSNPGEVLSSLTALSEWYGSKGIVEAFEGRSSESLCNSFWVDYFYNSMMKFSFLKAQKGKKGSLLGRAFGRNNESKPRISFNDQGLLLAKAFALGMVSEGERIGHDSLTGLREGWFYGTSGNNLTPFVLSAFAKWKNIVLSQQEFPFVIAEGYSGLLQTLTQGPDAIRSAFFEACEFHLARSRESNDRETYEFANPIYAVYPVEILFVMRVRQLLGLSHPEVDHPLLYSPLAKLPTTSCSISPELKPIQEKIERDYSVA